MGNSKRTNLVLASALLTTCLLVGVARAVDSPDMQVDADYPGGNILVKEIDGNTVRIAQDLRDTAGWWFYYNFRVSGAAGRELTFQWTNKNPMTSLGPAISTDQGRSWGWLGAERVRGDSFTYRFDENSCDVRFCLAMPYQLADLERFMNRHRENPAFRSTRHATTPNQRPVHRWHVGKLDGPTYRVLLMSRHHCCESTASHELEGIVEAILADDEPGRWLRDHVEFLVVPMMDVDGVDRGDQGKNRKPHDHNRDYQGASIHPSVAANKAFVPNWSRGKLRIVLDLHCPYVRGGDHNEQIYFVGGPDEAIWKNTQKLASILQSVQTGPLGYDVQHNLPWGRSWNTMPKDSTSSSSRWGASLAGVEVASTIEFPYALAGGRAITSENTRGFGRDLAAAIEEYLREETTGQVAPGDCSPRGLPRISTCDAPLANEAPLGYPRPASPVHHPPPLPD